MPDLTHRPTRYLTAALVAAALTGGAVARYDLRIGPDTRLSALQAQNAQLRAQADHRAPVTRDKDGRPVPRTHSGAQAAAASAPADVVTATAPGGGAAAGARPAARTGGAAPAVRPATATATRRGAPSCASYPDQETAQAAFDADRTGLAPLDGNANGVACEQLKHQGSAPFATHTAAPEPAAPVAAAPPPPGPVMPTAPSKAEILASGLHFGLSTATDEEYGSITTSLQRQADVTGWFSGWDSDFPRDRVVAAWSAGRIPYMTWESRPLTDTTDTTDYSLGRILDGTYDDYLTAYAQQVAALGLPLVIRFDQEMNGNWYRWTEFGSTVNHQGDFIKAWRHVHDIFTAQGAGDDVIWLWSPNRIDNLGRFPAMDAYWPGTAYVDEVGMTGYLRPEDRAPYTFAGTYDKTLNALRTLAPGLPIVLSEVGATEDGSHKADWVRNFFPGLLANPDVRGFTWFDYAITDKGHTNDWRIDSTTSSFAAFKAGLAPTSYGLPVGKHFYLQPPAAPAQVPAATLPSTSQTTAPRRDDLLGSGT